MSQRELAAILPDCESTDGWLRRMIGPQPYDWMPAAFDDCWLGPGQPLAESALRAPAGRMAAILLQEAGCSAAAAEALTAIAVASACANRIQDEILNMRMLYPAGEKSVWFATGPERSYVLYVFFADSAANVIRRNEPALPPGHRLELYQAICSESVRTHAGAAAWLSWLRHGRLCAVTPADFLQNLRDRWAGLAFRLPARMAGAVSPWQPATRQALAEFAESLGVLAHVAADWGEIEGVRENPPGLTHPRTDLPAVLALGGLETEARDRLDGLLLRAGTDPAAGLEAHRLLMQMEAFDTARRWRRELRVQALTSLSAARISAGAARALRELLESVGQSE